MRRINSEFQTLHISEEGQKISNRDYFGYVEMDDFACYVLADSLDEEPSVNSARLVVDSIIRDFTERPTMKKRAIRRYVHKAHEELLGQRKGMHLKASVIVAVTDYQSLLYCYAGNSRLYWIRNARILERTQDQSLTQNLLEQEKIPMDEAAAHEDRNNLYSFLGERGTPKLQFSHKKKLENGDIFALLTKGVWEQCEESELLGVINDAKEPADILNQTEDYILQKQDSTKIDNYTLVLTFVNKVYQSPKKPVSVKKILMIVLPILLIAAITGIGLYIRFHRIQMKKTSMIQYMESGQEYLRYDNYPKAAEEYSQAKTLADSLGYTEEAKEANQYVMLAEQIILADETLRGGEYKKAEELYLTAREIAMDAGNVGRSYIESQLDTVADYIEIFDLIAQGDRKKEYGNLEGAIALYKEAKEKSAAVYFVEGKKEALELQAAATEELEKAQMEDEKRLKEQIDTQKSDMAIAEEQKANDQKNAIDLENQGNELLAQGNYESAITFYQTAQAIYDKSGLSELSEGIEQKISAAKVGIAARDAAAANAANSQ